jgi:hypothetical protein
MGAISRSASIIRGVVSNMDKCQLSGTSCDVEGHLFMTLGMQRFSEGDYEAAAVCFKKVLSLEDQEKESNTTRYLLGSALLPPSKDPTARGDIQQDLQWHPWQGVLYTEENLRAEAVCNLAICGIHLRNLQEVLEPIGFEFSLLIL